MGQQPIRIKELTDTTKSPLGITLTILVKMNMPYRHLHHLSADLSPETTDD